MIKQMLNPRPARQKPPINRIANEIVNQLTVLNLVGSKIIFRCRARSGTELDRELEMFERSIQEATLLVRELVDHLAAPEKVWLGEAQGDKTTEGQVVRMLRSMTDKPS